MTRPPALAHKLLKWYAGKADLEDIQGDLDEVYGLTLEQSGKLKADLKYWTQVLSLLFSYGLKKRKSKAAYSPFYHKNSIAMLKNYFKIAYRNLKKQKAFTLINVLGLAMGMSIALLAIGMLAELSQFDEFHPNAENTYRVITRVNEGGDIVTYASSPPALTHLMDQQMSDIDASVHINDHFFPIIEHEGNEIDAWGYYTEPSFFDVFAFPIEMGSASVLNEPGNIIVTKEFAKKLFGKREAIGQVLQTKKWGQLRIAGVLGDFPKRTHLMFDILIGFPSSKKFNATHESSTWTEFRSNYYYFTIKDGTKDQVESNMETLGKAGEPFFNEDEKQATYDIQPLGDINPGDLMSDTIGIDFDKVTMWFFFGLSLLILAPACFNYTNMSIAIALKRAKEVGIRKVLGSHRKQIMGQFLVETIIICLLAVIISAFVYKLIRDQWVGMLMGGSSLIMEVSLGVVLLFILFAIATGLVTGAGPALYFAKISPIQALRSKGGDQKVNISGIRKGLLVFQFSLTLIFMIGIGVLLMEYQESRAFEYPMKIENTFVVPTQHLDVPLIQTAYAGLQGVKEVSFSSSIPGTPLSKNQYVFFQELQDSIRTRDISVDPSFIRHMDMELIWGSPLDGKPHQIEQVMANQEMMRRLRRMEKTGDTLLIDLGNDHKAQIVGIVKDYNHEPLNQRIEPMIIRSNKEELAYAIITMESAIDTKTYSQLESVWDELFPNTVFDAALLKNEIDNAYSFFHNGLKIFGFLATLAISISCLGLLGMVIFATENRTKEVAIRKILGANLKNLYGTLAGLFIKLWGIALLIAVPLSYFFYDKVLIGMYNKFSDGVGVLEIFLSISVTLLLGGGAIYWQVNKIARINPATNLRSE